MLRSIWKSYIAPILKRPPRFQVAALCYRHGEAGLEILLITSRETKRWVLPKGWPMQGTDAGGTALEEAWEEAGVKPRGAAPRRIGRYRYDKVLDGGLPMATDVDVYAIEVEKLYDQFPNAEALNFRLHEALREYNDVNANSCARNPPISIGNL